MTDTTTTGPGIHATLTRLAIPITQPRPRKGNPRRGDIDTIAESLTRNGQYRPIVVNKPTGAFRDDASCRAEFMALTHGGTGQASA